MSTSPRELIERAKQGDAESFGQLYETYLTPVYRYLLARICDRETAEDLTQQVFLKVWQKLDQLETRPEQEPLAYFFTVARNSLIDHTRRKTPLSLDTLKDDGYEPSTDENPGDPIDQAAKNELLLQALGMLSPEQREIISLRFFGRLSSEAAGRVTGQSSDAVRQSQTRAIRKLRQLLPINILL